MSAPSSSPSLPSRIAHPFDTIILAAGAVLFLMLMEEQQRAGAGGAWRQAGQWLKALLGPAVLPFYALLFETHIGLPRVRHRCLHSRL